MNALSFAARHRRAVRPRNSAGSGMVELLAGSFIIALVIASAVKLLHSVKVNEGRSKIISGHSWVRQKVSTTLFAFSRRDTEAIAATLPSGTANRLVECMKTSMCDAQCLHRENVFPIPDIFETNGSYLIGAALPAQPHDTINPHSFAVGGMSTSELKPAYFALNGERASAQDAYFGVMATFEMRCLTLASGELAPSFVRVRTYIRQTSKGRTMFDLKLNERGLDEVFYVNLR